MAAADVWQYTIADPTVDGYRLDWCYVPGDQCGIRAATEWCKTQHYAEEQHYAGAIDFLDDPDVGQTKVLSNGEICSGAGHCASFRSITCIGTLSPSQQTFPEPTVDGYRLDWCYVPGGECGIRAATQWCKTQGYGGAVDFLEDPDVGQRGIQTKVLSNGEICNADFCDSFREITCMK